MDAATQLNFHSDPGHGWLEAPMTLVNELGIASEISEYSYKSGDGDVAYLEEDCDAAVLLKSMKDAGKPYTIRELNQAFGNSFIRRLPRFRPIRP